MAKPVLKQLWPSFASLHKKQTVSSTTKCRLGFERQVAEREGLEAKHETSLTAAECKLNATALLRPSPTALPAVCYNCCSWQQPKQKMSRGSNRL